MWYLQKTFRFEAAHRLVNKYPGKCKFVHGHSWVVDVQVKGDELDHYDFLTDYGNLKPIGKLIDEKMDHAMLVSDQDKEMIKFLTDNDQKHLVIQGNPTSENIAKLIFNWSCHMGLGVEISRVTIHETCSSRCDYYGQNK